MNISPAGSSSYDHHPVSAIVPLAILRTLQTLDRTLPADFEQYAEQTAPRRLGASATVSAQIERYSKLVKARANVDNDEVMQLFRLVGRRNDAELAFTEAGRLAALETLGQTSTTSRLVHRAGKVIARQRTSFALASRLAARLLGVEMSFDDDTGTISAIADGRLSGSAPDGKSCGFFGSALAELLRKCTGFEGAMIHDKCRARGDDVCSWQSGSARDQVA